MVREYKGSHSGEHGDGIVRSEFHESDVRRSSWCNAFEEVKDRFDPHHLLNPGKIVRAPKFDDLGSTSATGPDYHADELATALDWSAYTGVGGRVSRARSKCATTTAPAASLVRRRHVPELSRHP